VCLIRHTSTSTGPGLPVVSADQPADRLDSVRYLALLVLAVVFLTGLVWWAVFIGNAVIQLVRRK
jgi:hypothetical protein